MEAAFKLRNACGSHAPFRVEGFGVEEHRLKLAHYPHSLIAALATLPSISLIPSSRFCGKQNHAVFWQA